MRLATLLLLATLLPSSLLMAQERMQETEVRKVPAHTPEWTDVKSADPGTTDSVVDELQGIVVLCATEPGSETFKKEWQAWLKDNYHPDMDVDAVIADVLRRADRYSKKTKGKALGKKRSQKASGVMHDTAKSMIQSVR